MNIEELIVLKLDTAEKRLAKLDEHVALCRIEIAGLKVKSGVWGAVAGMIPVIIGLGMMYMSMR